VIADLAALAAAVAAGNRAAAAELMQVVIGGAPTTPELAAQVGADGYVPDAEAAVDLARGLLAS
jgi:methanogenic corrinoid protein MtbC1